MMGWLIQTYKFTKFPSPKDDFDFVRGIIFENGTFETKQGDKINLTLTVYNDGLIADTASSTQDSDAFLEEMLYEIAKIFNLPSIGSIPTRIAYQSQLFVSTDKSLEMINPKLKGIADFLSANTEGYKKHFYEFGGITFWPDQTKIINPPAFVFERAALAPFSENRYYSIAALSTDKHLELLEKIEVILGS